MENKGNKMMENDTFVVNTSVTKVNQGQSILACFGLWLFNTNLYQQIFVMKKETAINDGFSVTKLPGLLLRLQHHISICHQICQTVL